MLQGGNVKSGQSVSSLQRYNIIYWMQTHKQTFFLRGKETYKREFVYIFCLFSPP
jgi:hypothetical protein